MSTVARRGFLIGSAAIVGGAAFGVYRFLKDPENPLSNEPGKWVLNPYVIIDQSGVSIVTPRAEMGQGVQTTLAAIVAEELDVAWDAIRSINGPASAAYYNAALLPAGLPFADYEENRLRDWIASATVPVSKALATQATGGSTSIREGFDRMRAAGAAARETLARAGAKRLGVSRREVRTEDGAVIGAEGARLAYAELAADAARLTPPRDPRLKAPSEWRYLGKSMPRLDVAAKSTGAAEFGIDVRLDGMVYAGVRANPRLGGEMRGFDAEAAEAMPGVLNIVDLGDAVAAVATNTWRAFRAVEAIKVDWGPAPYPPDTDQIFQEIETAFAAKPNSTLRDDGDVDGALDRDDAIEAEYRVPYLAHACMETMNAVGLYKDGKLEIWCGNQAPVIFSHAAADAAELDDDQVTVHTPFMGGGFGRRGEIDIAVQIAKLARAMEGTPVKLTWSREEDMRHDFYRPGVIARAKGIPGPSGPKALRLDIASASVFRNQGERALGSAPPGPDKIMVEGAFDQPYAIPNYRVRGFISDVAVPVGSWRSVGNSHNAFFHECFVDQLARASGADPIEMRLAMMKEEHEPSYRVVEAVADMANWSAPRADGRGRGVAFTHSFGSPTAQIIEIRQTERGVKIEKVWCAIDVGLALDPRNIEAQVMSGIIYGLSAAVSGEITFKDGQVRQSNFHDYDGLRMHQAPEIEVRILENNDDIGGVGEPGTPPAAPALANAVFDLTGERIRELPLNKRVRFV